MSKHPTAQSTVSDGEAMLRRMFDEGFSTGDPGVVDELCSPDLIEHQFGLAGAGAEALVHVKAAMVDVHGAVPNIQFTIEKIAHSDDLVWALVRARGTATGPFFGPPSNADVDFYVIDIARIVNGRIAEHWGVPDRFALLAQTGVLARLNG